MGELKLLIKCWGQFLLTDGGSHRKIIIIIICMPSVYLLFSVLKIGTQYLHGLTSSPRKQNHNSVKLVSGKASNVCFRIQQWGYVVH